MVSIILWVSLTRLAWSASPCAPRWVWSRTVNGTATTDDQANAVAAAGGAPVVAGMIQTTGENWNWMIEKYDANGNVTWSWTYNSPGNNNVDLAYGVAVDGSGNVIVAGSEKRLDIVQSDNWLIRKYDSTGGLVWSRSHNNPVNGTEIATAVAVDAAGTVVVTGRDQYAGPSHGWLTRAYSSAGGLLWSRTWRSPGAAVDYPFGVAIDASSGEVVVVGQEERTDLGQSYNVGIRRYDAAGADVWSASYSSPGAVNDAAHAVAIDSSGSVYVSAHETRSGQGMNWLVRKYSSAGALVWSVSYNGAANGDDVAYGVAVDAGGVLVAGHTTVSGQGTNLMVRRYDFGGSVVWTLTYNGSANGNDAALAIAVDAAGAFTVAGYETVTGQAMNWMVQRYAMSGAMSAWATAVPSVVSVGQATTVTLSLTNSGCADLGPMDGALAAGPGAALGSVTAGPTPMSVPLLSPGASTVIAWSWTATGPGAVVFTATGAGWDTASGSTVYAYATAGLLVQTGASLLGAVSVSSTLVVIGAPFTISLTVTNAGQAAALGVTPWLVLTGSGGATVWTGPVPAVQPSLAGGSAVTFVWTLTATALGTVIWSASAAGTDANAGWPVHTGILAGMPVTVTGGAELVVNSLALSPAPSATPGATVTATLVLGNPGGGAVSVTALARVETESGAAVLGPGSSLVPSLPLTIAGGASTTLTWTYLAGTCGTAVSSVAAVGVEISTGNSVGPAPGVSNQIGVAGSPAVIVGSIVESCPAPGQTVRVTVTVYDSCAVPVPVPAIPIVFTLLTGGGLASATGTTDSGGRCTALWTLPAGVGTRSLRIDAGGVPSTTVSLATQAAVLTLTPPATTVDVGATVTVRARLLDACGSPLAGHSVTFALSGPGTASPGSGTTNAAGDALVQYVAGTVAGSAVLEATAPAQGVTASMSVTIADLAGGLRLTTPGAALDRNVFEAGAGGGVLTRIAPATAGPIRVEIFTASGRSVRTLRTLDPIGGGQFVCRWDGRTEDGIPVSRGVYILRVSGGGLNERLKVVAR